MPERFATEATVFQWIEQASELKTTLESIEKPRHIGIDTEFVRERTYYPKLALVQLQIDEKTLLVDPLREGIGAVLQPYFTDNSILKIMHSPSEDLQTFQSGFGFLPSPMFDTQLAAALCGDGAALGYQALVEKITGQVLEKGETRSDWLQRPLTDSQKKYAAEDVLHLHEMHQVLSEKLLKLNRLQWLQADCARTIDNASHDVIDPQPHLSIRSAEQLDTEGQARLRRLMLWREHAARHADRPKTWILDNELLFIFAKRVPENKAHYLQILDRNPRAPRKSRDQLWDEISRALTTEELDIPLITRGDEADKNLLKQLQKIVADEAVELNIPEGLLASRKHLEALITQGQWTAFFNAWRKDILQTEFSKLIATLD